MLALSPIIQVYHISQDKDKTNPDDTPNNINDNSIMNEIIDSFGLENRVFADCSAYGTDCSLTAPNVCVIGGSTAPGAANAVESGGSGTYPITVSIQNGFSISFSPSTQNFNNYPTGPPSNHSATLNYTVTGPSISVTDDPGDSSGPYGGLGRKKYTITAHADFQDWNGSAWTGSIDPFNTPFILSADHADTTPSLNSISSNYSTTVSSSSTLTNVPVSVSFNDTESNDMTVTLELTNNSYSTILQTTTFTNVSTGEVLNHTFTNLPVGSYEWRASAVETDGVGTCAGFSNAIAGSNLSVVSPNVTINISLTGSSSGGGGGSGSPTVCSSQKPGQPSNLIVTAGPKSGQKTLNWVAPTGPVTDYSISYSDDPNIKRWGVISTGNVTTYTISELGNGTYYFWVNAINGCMPGDPITPSGLLVVGPEDIWKIGIIGIFLLALGSIMIVKTKAYS